MSSDSFPGMHIARPTTVRGMNVQGDIPWQDGTTIAARAILRLRQENDWSREDVAHATRLTKHTVRRWEVGEVSPPPARVADAIHHAGVLPEDMPEWGIASPAILARFGGMLGDPVGSDGYSAAESPPAWAQQMLTELHSLRDEMRRYREDCAS